MREASSENKDDLQRRAAERTEGKGSKPKPGFYCLQPKHPGTSWRVKEANTGGLWSQLLLWATGQPRIEMANMSQSYPNQGEEAGVFTHQLTSAIHCSGSLGLKLESSEELFFKS